MAATRVALGFSTRSVTLRSTGTISRGASAPPSRSPAASVGVHPTPMHDARAAAYGKGVGGDTAALGVGVGVGVPLGEAPLARDGVGAAVVAAPLGVGETS